MSSTQKMNLPARPNSTFDHFINIDVFITLSGKL